MIRKFIGISLLTALLATCGGAFPALAEGGQAPEPGEMFTARTILCDTQEEVMDIITAAQADGFVAGREVYVRYRLEKNPQGEPRCTIGDIMGISLKMIPVGEMPTSNLRGSNDAAVIEFRSITRPDLPPGFIIWFSPLKGQNISYPPAANNPAMPHPPAKDREA